MKQGDLFTEFRKLKLKRALSELEKIQKRLESELNEPDQILGDYESITGQQRAKEIMGDNMICIEDVAEIFGVSFSVGQITQLLENFYYEQTLQNCRDTHILFPGYPITISEISHKKSDLVICNRECREGFWYDYKDMIYKDTPKCRWYLVKKDLIFNSRPQLDETEEMLSPVEIIFMIVLYQEIKNTRLFSNTFLRCFKHDYCLRDERICNAYINTSEPAISIFHPFNHQHVSHWGVVISQKNSLMH